MIKKLNTYTHFIIFGIVLILIGLLIQVPGGALTTLESIDGNSTDYYVFDNKYSSIDEYVGGDAYNYIIGASLVAGKMAGTMTAKVVLVVGGIICLCFGLTFMTLYQKEKEKNSLTRFEPCSTKESETFNDSSESLNIEENVIVDSFETDKSVSILNEN